MNALIIFYVYNVQYEIKMFILLLKPNRIAIKPAVINKIDPVCYFCKLNNIPFWINITIHNKHRRPTHIII